MTAVVTNPFVMKSDARSGAIALATLALVAAVYAGDARSLWDLWSEPQRYSHGFLVTALIPWLVWRERARLCVEAQTPLLPASMVLLGLGLAWFLLRAANIDVFRYALLPAIAITSVLMVFGIRAATALAFPLAWFLCAVPLWDGLNSVLQSITALAARFAVAVAGIPARLDGDLVTVPAGTFEVAAGCSGLKYVVVAITVSTLYGHVEAFSWRGRALLVALAMLLSMVMNWIRVTTVIIAGQLTAMQSSLVADSHLVFGWWLFAIGLGIFFVIARLLPLRRATRAGRGATHEVGPGTARAVIGGRMVLVAVLLGLAPAYYGFAANRSSALAARTTSGLPPGRGAWSGPEAANFAWHPEFVQPTFETRAAYRAASGSVFVDVTYYAVERRGAKLVGYGSDPRGPRAASVLIERARSLGGSDMAVERVRELIVRTPDDRYWRIWQWYQIDHDAVIEPSRVKLYEARHALTAQLGAASISVVAACIAQCGDDERVADLTSYMQDMSGAVIGALPGGSSVR